jgi:dienelactone hydrolase family protein
MSASRLRQKRETMSQGDIKTGHTRQSLASANGGRRPFCPSICMKGPPRLRTALKDTRQRSEFIVYPDAPHGFNADYRPTYRKQPAEDGWKRMLEWFKKNGIA